MSKLLSFRKKNISISVAGTDIPIYLLDGSNVVVKITPTTSAGAACVVVRDKVSWLCWSSSWPVSYRLS
jgi:hypothetical protein